MKKNTPTPPATRRHHPRLFNLLRKPALRTRGAFWATAVLSGIALIASVHASDLKLPLLWTTNLKTFLESAPTLADINGDGRDEALIAGREELIALDGTGKALWRWRTQGRFMTYPSVLARPGQPALIYVADTSGLFTCVDGTGKEVWHTQLNGPSSWCAPVVCDLDSDGAPEVIEGDGKGTIWAFEALTGKPVWQASVRGIPVSPAVGDLDGDGKAEVVVATGNGVIAAIGEDGTQVWEREIGGSSQSWATSAPVMFACSDGSVRIAAASSEGWLFCLNNKGNVLWRCPVRGPVASSISVGDLDLDGRADIFVITQLGVVYRFDENGNAIWDIDMQGRSLAAGAIIDMNGDDKLEYALCTQPGHLLVLDNQGEFVFDWQFANRTINVTPTFGDMTPDSPGLEMVITGGESGKTFCFGTQAPADTLTQWTTYRHDARMTGSWFGLARTEAARMIPRNLAWDRMFTGESIRFSIHNPSPGDQPLKATAVCLRPDGERQVAVTSILGKRGELLLPVKAIVPGTYRFTWSLASAEGRELFSGARDISVKPFANDRAIAERAKKALKVAADAAEESLPLSATALRREAMLLNNDLKTLRPLQDAAPGGDASMRQKAIEQTARLVTRAKRALHLSHIIRQAIQLGSGTSLIAFEGTTWENRNVDQQLPSHVVNPFKIHRRVVPGEHEPVSLKLFNVTDHPLQARVQIDTFSEGLVVTPRRSVSVPTSLGEVSWDPLPKLDEASLVTVPSLSSREVWLDIKVGDIKAGERSLRVRFQVLNGAGVLDAPKNPHAVAPPETVVEITLNILPFKMAPPGTMRLCSWAHAETPEFKDLLAHGNNVFTVSLPSAKYDAQGHLQTDFSKLDSMIGQVRGEDVILLLQGIPALRGKLGSAAYSKTLKPYLDGLVDHLSGQGIDTDHFALYPVDEPGGQGWNAVNKVVAFGKAARAVNPHVMLYVDGGGELPMFQAMAPYIDIWCPGINMLPENSPEMDLMRTTGKMLWSYNCSYSYSRPVGPNLKNTNIVAEYRIAALFAFRHGATGIGYWCYNIGEDPWTRAQNEYMLVYPGRNGPVTSRRWEAVREGIEDFRILTALRKYLRSTRSAQLKEDVRARIRHLLEFHLPEMVDQSFNEMNLGLARNVIDLSNNDETVRDFRSEMMDCVRAVSDFLTKGNRTRY